MRTKSRLGIAGLVLLGSLAATASAGARGRYYPAPPVVYGEPGYYPPPVVYGPGVGVVLPGINPYPNVKP
jgi:hypothetical protein